MAKAKIEKIYRVFDNKNNYSQSYSSKIDNAFSFARDCALRVAGRVEESDLLDLEASPTIVFDCNEPKK